MDIILGVRNPLRGQIEGSHRATNLIMPSHQGNKVIIQIMPGKVAFSYPPFDDFLFISCRNAKCDGLLTIRRLGAFHPAVLTSQLHVIF